MCYLHKKELIALSNAKQKRTLLSWLDDLGIKHIPDADGWPVVAESAIRAKLGEPTKREPRINFG